MLQAKSLSALKLSLFVSFILAALKISIGFLTNSVAILSLAVDSLGDLLSSLFNYFFLQKSQEPADEEHPFGHGKFENFASFIQGLILIASAIWVGERAIHKFVSPQQMYHVGLGTVVIAICFLVSFLAGRWIHKTGEECDSSLLKVEALHLLMDSYLYLVVIGALIFSKLGFPIFDPIASLAVSGYLLWISFGVVRASFDVLTDKSLTEKENAEIIAIIKDHKPAIIEFDQFQTRKSGSVKHIHFRLFICKKMSLGRSHDIVDHIEQEIQKKISGAQVLIHAEPAKEDCSKHAHELEPRHFTQ